MAVVHILWLVFFARGEHSAARGRKMSPIPSALSPSSAYGDVRPEKANADTGQNSVSYHRRWCNHNPLPVIRLKIFVTNRSHGGSLAVQVQWFAVNVRLSVTSATVACNLSLAGGNWSWDWWIWEFERLRRISFLWTLGRNSWQSWTWNSAASSFQVRHFKSKMKILLM